jgi:formylmethanofuran dehydrogenase subunit D
MGPWANQVTSTEMYSTGMPHFKGVKVSITPAPNETVQNGIRLLQQAVLNLKQEG